MVAIKNTILLVEDDLDNLELFVEIFQLKGYEVLPSSNAEACITITKSKIPNLFISDVRLPGLDGFGLLKYFRSHPVLKQVPFIFLSACSENSMIRKGLQLGAADYLVKPCGIEVITSSVQKTLCPKSLKHNS